MKYWLLFCFALCFAEPTICLNMIVKDESPVIRRCLDSVKPFIDSWVIVDTGSTDGTQKIIKDFMKDLPGELHERPWVNFEHNRNEALKLAKNKGDYVLFIDADEVFEGKFDKKSLTKDHYLIEVLVARDLLSKFNRGFLVNNNLNWRWEGVLHEYIVCPEDRSSAVLQNAAISAVALDGHRAQDPKKFLKDAQVLEEALKKDPNNSTYIFYLAQSYAQGGEYALALKNYQKRASMDGWDELVFWCKYYIGFMQEFLQMDPQVIVKSFCEAYHYRPTRVEPIFRLALHFYNHKQYVVGYALAKCGLTLAPMTDTFFSEMWMQIWGLDYILGHCALEIGKKEEARIALEKVMKQADLPENVRDQIAFISLRLKAS